MASSISFGCSDNENKKRIRFSSQDDLVLLREVISTNPFEDLSRWEAIKIAVTEKCGKMFTIRGLKEHLEYLLKKFSIKDDQNKTMTGVEETYNEYDHLLQQIGDIFREPSAAPKSKLLLKTSQLEKGSSFFEKSSIEKGKELREFYLQKCFKDTDNEVQITRPTPEQSNENLPIPLVKENIKTSTPSGSSTSKQKVQFKMNNILTPNRSRQPRRLKHAALDFLEEKNVKEHSIKLKELELEEKRLALKERTLNLEEKKLNHQMDMDKKRLELEAIRVKMEQVEKKKSNDIIENYQKIIDTLIKNKSEYI